MEENKLTEEQIEFRTEQLKERIRLGTRKRELRLSDKEGHDNKKKLKARKKTKIQKNSRKKNR